MSRVGPVRTGGEQRSSGSHGSRRARVAGPGGHAAPVGHRSDRPTVRVPPGQGQTKRRCRHRACGQPLDPQARRLLPCGAPRIPRAAASSPSVVSYALSETPVLWTDLGTGIDAQLVDKRVDRFPAPPDDPPSATPSGTARGRYPAYGTGRPGLGRARRRLGQAREPTGAGQDQKGGPAGWTRPTATAHPEPTRARESR